MTVWYPIPLLLQPRRKATMEDFVADVEEIRKYCQVDQAMVIAKYITWVHPQETNMEPYRNGYIICKNCPFSQWSSISGNMVCFPGCHLWLAFFGWVFVDKGSESHLGSPELTDQRHWVGWYRKCQENLTFERNILFQTIYSSMATI